METPRLLRFAIVALLTSLLTAQLQPTQAPSIHDLLDRLAALGSATVAEGLSAFAPAPSSLPPSPAQSRALAGILENTYHQWPTAASNPADISAWIALTTSRLQDLQTTAKVVDKDLDPHFETAVQLLTDYSDLLTSNHLLEAAVKAHRESNGLGISIDLGVIGAQASTKGGMPGAIAGLALMLIHGMVSSGASTEEHAATVRTQALGLQRRFDSALSVLERSGFLGATPTPFQRLRALRAAPPLPSTAVTPTDNALDDISQAVEGFKALASFFRVMGDAEQILEAETQVIEFIPRAAPYASWRLDALTTRLQHCVDFRFAAASTPTYSAAGNEPDYEPLAWAHEALTLCPADGRNNLLVLSADALALTGLYPVALEALDLLPLEGRGADVLYRRAKLLSLLDSGLAQQALKEAFRAVFCDTDRAHTDPDWENRRRDLKSFEELCAPRFDYQLVEGTVWHDFKIVNRAHFPLTNLTIVLHFKWDSEESYKTLQLARLEPGAAHTWPKVCTTWTSGVTTRIQSAHSDQDIPKKQ